MPQLKAASELEYNVQPAENYPFMSISEGARELGIEPGKMGRYLRILQLPVFEQGHSYVFRKKSNVLRRVKKALDNGEIKRGRKRK